MSDSSKIASIITHLSRKALEWARPVLNGGGDLTISYDCFISQFDAIFQHPTDGKERSERLLKLEGVAQQPKPMNLNPCKLDQLTSHLKNVFKELNRVSVYTVVTILIQWRFAQSVLRPRQNVQPQAIPAR